MCDGADGQTDGHRTTTDGRDKYENVTNVESTTRHNRIGRAAISPRAFASAPLEGKRGMVEPWYRFAHVLAVDVTALVVLSPLFSLCTEGPLSYEVVIVLAGVFLGVGNATCLLCGTYGKQMWVGTLRLFFSIAVVVHAITEKVWIAVRDANVIRRPTRSACRSFFGSSFLHFLILSSFFPPFLTSSLKL